MVSNIFSIVSRILYLENRAATDPHYEQEYCEYISSLRNEGIRVDIQRNEVGRLASVGIDGELFYTFND